VDIANLATGFFGEDDQIRSPDDDSKPARAVRAVWAKVRKFVFTKANWSCGRRRSRIAARAADNAFPVLDPYTHAFPVPARFARLVRILEPAELRAEYVLLRGPKGREIHIAHSGPLEIEWIEDVQEWSLWSAEFTEAFAMRLAWQIADRLSGDKQRKQQALEAYLGALRDGAGSDARQQPPMRHAATDWAAARRGGTERAPNT
jgi:hypothetical protein